MTQQQQAILEAIQYLEQADRLVCERVFPLEQLAVADQAELEAIRYLVRTCREGVAYLAQFLGEERPPRQPEDLSEVVLPFRFGDDTEPLEEQPC